MDNNENNTKYGYSLQYYNIEDCDSIDNIYTGPIYTNIDYFTEYINNEIKNIVNDYEGINIDELNEISNLNEKLKYNLKYYPITKEQILNMSYEYIYYDKDMVWFYAIVANILQ